MSQQPKSQQPKRKYKIAIAGATGNVGRECLEILHERQFPVTEIVALASKSSAGKEVSFGEGTKLRVQALDDYDFKGTDIALFSPGSKVSAIHAPRAAEAGCIVIDNTSQFRMDADIPLIVPEVNPQALVQYKQRMIIANPNCSTIQMLVALKPLHDFATIKRIVVSTYQSVSGAGKAAMDELYSQTKAKYMFEEKEPQVFTKRIAFNVIPHIDSFLDDGSTKEEIKMVKETQKILDPSILVSSTCVRVPVFVGHSESVNVEFEKPISPEKARELLNKAPGVTVIDRHENGGYATPAEIVREDDVFVSRIRKDPTLPHGLNLWVVGDNIRKGAALNAVQIAEMLIRDYI
ncbi:MAG: aspartate-semialdehyde dehydrogenase [Alphaproteobacteria bacterium]|nr:aspartate-semialdehyde dehydrogenase [Alphaproteobacteria bacterium]